MKRERSAHIHECALGIHRFSQPYMNRIGQTHANGVAMRFRRQPSHINAADKRRHFKYVLQQRAVMMCVTTDDVRIHADAADVFTDLIDHQ